MHSLAKFGSWIGRRCDHDKLRLVVWKEVVC